MQPLRQAHDMALQLRIVSVPSEFDDSAGSSNSRIILTMPGSNSSRGWKIATL